MKRTCHGNNIQGGGTKGHVNLVEKTIFLWHGVPLCTHLNFNKLTTIFTCEKLSDFNRYSPLFHWNFYFHNFIKS